jgi:hypothetical protein
LFKLPLQTLVLSSNCISGTLPNRICASPNLTNLILDGIQTNCKHASSHSSHGSIPSCIFSTPQLQTLHLVGNGLTGTIPDIPSNSTIQNINLARNRLSGMSNNFNYSSSNINSNHNYH